MNSAFQSILWRQLGAAIDMLERAMNACPEEVWGDRRKQPEYWYIAYHTLFFLDFYFSEMAEGFTPPAPFGLEELDPAGVMPPGVYSKAELMTYLAHCRAKCRAAVRELTVEKSDRSCGSLRPGLTFGELYLYVMRHVQHHTGQLNLLLRQNIDSAPRWVSKAAQSLDDN